MNKISDFEISIDELIPYRMINNTLDGYYRNCPVCNILHNCSSDISYVVSHSSIINRNVNWKDLAHKCLLSYLR